MIRVLSAIRLYSNERSAHLDELLLQANRQPDSVKRTMMVMLLCGRDESELIRRANFAYRNWVPELRDQSFETLMSTLDGMFSPMLNSVGATFCPVVGTPDAVIEQIHTYARAGVEEMMIQWWDVEDTEGLALYAEQILPNL